MSKRNIQTDDPKEESMESREKDLGNLRGRVRMSSICVISPQERAGRENEEEEISGERMSRNGSNLWKTTDKEAIMPRLPTYFQISFSW